MATHAIMKSFRSSLIPAQSKSHRSFFYWITIMFNRVDENRVKEVGPDRACAEWLLRNGAAVKWREDGSILSDYNALSSLEEPQKHIEAVDATNSAISYHGFPHFNGCNYINEVKLVNCVYVEDPAIPLLSILKNTLKHLEISNCLNISEKALFDLNKLTKLKKLELGNLPQVKNKSEVIEKLTKSLPDCNIVFT
ncbi:ATP synthase subunit s, mitochondrial [Neodiprion fabricii]|uniref:ATP synthase subunit s, mitochondrial n=1 Tax=Neodiprion fabricii TaxID=2872261 RepID=UPI001ED91434|nr:ATP synthase subunit s, mitochondrial [Neodiprion fabricii]